MKTDGNEKPKPTLVFAEGFSIERPFLDMMERINRNLTSTVKEFVKEQQLICGTSPITSFSFSPRSLYCMMLLMHEFKEKKAHRMLYAFLDNAQKKEL